MRDAANNQAGAAGLLMGATAGIGSSNMMNQQVGEAKDDPMAKLKKLKDMFEAELISEEDYTTKKKEILDTM